MQVALTDTERGFDFEVKLDDDALDFICDSHQWRLALCL